MNENIFDLQLGIWLAIGAFVVLVLLQSRQQGFGVGLVLAYLVMLAVLHLPGAFLYIQDRSTLYNATLVRLGFEQTLYGVLAFTLGVLTAGLLFRRVYRTPASPHVYSPQETMRTAHMCLVLGLASLFVIAPLLGSLPTLGAILSVTSQLILVGICLACWHNWQGSNLRGLIGWAALLGVFPFLTIFTQGFLGFGAGSLIIGLMFIASFFRPRPVMWVSFLILAYVGLSIFVTYARDRDSIRSVVWAQSPFEERAAQMVETFGNFEWFSLQDTRQQNLVDGRLNQNWLVGAAVSHTDGYNIPFASGATVESAIINLIPRAIWPEKPTRAGGNALVTQYTGIGFANGTSVGIGQVMEFYINFGTDGVIVGFFILGLVLSLVDRLAAAHLLLGNLPGFLFWFLGGLGFLLPGNSLVELGGTVAASFLTAFLINRFLLPIFGRSRTDRNSVASALASLPR